MLLPIRVNAVEARWLVDTGAAQAVVNEAEARRLGLRKTKKIVRLTGVGKRVAVQAEPVVLKWKGRRCMVAPYIIKDLIVLGLVGLKEAEKLKLMIRPGNRTMNVLFVDERITNSTTTTEQIPPPTEDPDPTKDELEKSELIKSKISQDLTEEQRERVWEVIERNKRVWLKPTFGCVKTKAQFIPIDRPVKDKLRPMSAELRDEMDKQIDELLRLKVIRPSKSPWASSPVFVRKADGSWRMAIDYRRVNQRIKTDGYPIPLLWEQLQIAGGHLFYARLDGKSGFFNVPLTEGSKELTAFNSHRGLFEYNVLPFGIKNSPAEFQRVMDDILSELYGKGVLCYIDDIVIYSNSFIHWVELIHQVFQKLWDGGVYVEPKKCEFGPKEIPVLGHILSKEGIMPNPNKVKAVKAARAPTNRKELMSFLGLVGFIRRFIPNYSENTASLSGLLKKNAMYEWTEKCEKEFERLKDLVAENILLSVPSGRGPYVIFSDASDRAIGSALAQWRDKTLHLLEFASHKFTPAEVNWSTREREAYTIKWAVQRFEPYIKGAKIYVLTDHASLQWIHKAEAGKVQRWALYLQQFDVRVRAISGADNGMADWLSRSIVSVEPQADEEIDAISTPVHTVVALTQEEEDAKSYARSPYLPTYSQWVEASKTIPEDDKKYMFKGKNDLWYSNLGRQLYIPKYLRESLLYYFHAGKYGGHFGINKTQRRLAKWFFWPHQRAEVSEYVGACLPCKRIGPPSKRYLKQVLERSEPFQLVSLDHVGPREWDGKKVHYLVIIDHFSRFAVAKSVKEVGGAETVRVFSDYWVKQLGAPEAVLVDRGKAYTSKAFQSYVRDQLAADLVYCSTHYPQGNAMNESVHKGIEASIAARRQYDTATGHEEILGDAILAYNSTPHSSTGLSPFYMLFGKELMLPGLQRYREGLTEPMRRARIKENRLQAMRRAMMTADERLRLYKDPKVQEGDRVVYYLTPSERKEERVEEVELVKYGPKWSTPVTVTKVKGGSVELDCGRNKKVTVPARHVRHIGRDVPPSLQPLMMNRIPWEPARISIRPDWESDTGRKRPRQEEEAE